MGAGKPCAIIACALFTLAAIALIVLLIVDPCLFNIGDCDGVSYMASAKLSMVDGTRRRLHEATIPSEQMINLMNNRRLLGTPSSSDTPTELCITIVYAYLVEGTQFSCDPGVDCSTFGPRRGDGPADLGDCVYNINTGITGCSGDCCMNAIIYENPSCCLEGFTPSNETVEQCTFDGHSDGSCQSECDIYHSEKPSRCSEWPGNGPTATLSDCIDLTEGQVAVNAALGATVLPIIKSDPYEDFTSLGGKFRGIRVDFGGKTLGGNYPDDMASNIRFTCPGLAQKEYFWDSGSAIEYYLASGDELTVNTDDMVTFNLAYDVTDVCDYYDSWTDTVGSDCTTGGVLDESQDICNKRASGCYDGTGAYSGQVVCLNPVTLSMVPGFSVVRADGTTETST